MKYGLMMVYGCWAAFSAASSRARHHSWFSLPLSIGGAIVALLLGGMQLTVRACQFGILMLMGIVTKNAIMLVDFAMSSFMAACRETKRSSMQARSALSRSS